MAGGRPKKPEGVEKKDKRVTFLVKKSFLDRMEADMEKKGFKGEKSAYVISAIEEYMKKKS